MSERDFRLFLHDILESIEKIEKYTANVTMNYPAAEQAVRQLFDAL